MDDQFYKQFKEVYDAIDIIGKEVFKMSAELTRLTAEVGAVKGELIVMKNESSRQSRASVAPEAPHIAAPPIVHEVPQAPPVQSAPHSGHEPPVDPTRSRTGSFQPGDAKIDVGNVFYFGNKKK